MVFGSKDKGKELRADRIEALQKAIEKAIKSAKLPQAISAYEELLSLDPRDATAMNQLGDLYIRTGNFKEAFKHYQRLGDHYDRTGLLPKGIAIYLKMYRIDPKNTDVALKLADLYKRSGLEIEAKRIYIEVAEFLKSQKRSDDVLEVYRKLADLDQENEEIRERLAEIYEKQGNRDHAAEEYRRIADIYQKKRLPEQAIEALKKALAFKPNLLILKKILDLLKEQDRLSDAVRLAEETVQLDPSNRDFKKTLGLLYMEIMDFTKAEALFLELSSLGGEQEIDVYEQLTKLHTNRKDFDKAFSFIEPVVESLVENGQQNKAQELISIILSDNPSYLPALWKRATIYEKSKQTTSLVLALNAIAEVFKGEGNMEEVKKILRRLIELEPSNENYRFDLESLEKQEEKKDSEQYFEHRKEEQTLVKQLDQFDKIFDGGFKEEAVRDVESLDTMYPENPKIKEKLLQYYLKLESLDKALSTGLQILSIYERLQLKDLVEATARRLLISFPNNPNLSNYLNETVTEISPDLPSPEEPISFGDDKAKLQELLSEIDFYIAQEFSDEARSKVMKALALYPNNPLLLERLGKLDESSPSLYSAPEAPSFQVSSPTPTPQGEPPLDIFSAPVQASAQSSDDLVFELSFDSDEIGEAPPVQPKDADLFETPSSASAPLTPERDEHVAKGSLDLPAGPLTGAEEEPSEAMRASEADAPLFGEDEEEVDISLDLPVGPFTDTEEEAPEATRADDTEDERTEEGLTPLTFDTPSRESSPTPTLEKEEPLQEADLGDDTNPNLSPTSFPFSSSLDESLSPPAEAKVQGLSSNDDLPFFNEEDLFANLPQDDEKSFVPTPAFPQEEGEAKEDLLLGESDIIDDLGQNFFSDDEIFDIEQSYYFEVGTIVSQELKAIQEATRDAKDNDSTTMERSLDDILFQFKEKLDETLDKEDYDTRYNLGIAYFGMGLYDEAVNEFLIASRGPLWKFDSYVHLGLSFFNKGIFPEAERWFQEALKIPGRDDEEYLAIKYELAKVYEMKGEVNEAVGLYRQILTKTPDFQDVKMRLKTLLG